ncbi:hypothetical protein NH8B_0940 [Pseudogulbenkiania sp. NH8B]|uniref:hypothetical protein n=1 Tax=Pseudogulbenkiania sp. (strain NH8B) TaxID=748280 RepID=UPI0002279A0C|nr:hypothetical protein [Pseudogulbenkiania sp. NH8B]BAK75772.1 hypothetical protein NH8B_0940 [Pseudogulbenkiania sp. NH8B]
MKHHIITLLLAAASATTLAGDFDAKHRLGPAEFGERYAVNTVASMPSDQTQAVLIAAGSTISQQRADLIGSGTTADGKEIFTGKRGGKYYHSAGGDRVYIK